MALPSVPEIVTALKDILTIVAEGGQKAILFIFLLDFLFIFFVIWLGFKLFVTFLKNTNEKIEKIVAQKDELLNNARKRSEEQNVQYAELLARFLERDNKNMADINDLKTLLTTFFVTNNGRR